MSAVTETLAIFVGIDSLALPFLIGVGKLHTRKPRRRTKTTAAEAVRVASPVPATAAGNTAVVLSAVPDSAAVATAVADALERRSRRLPPLPPADEMKHPRLAEFARSRPRDPHTGQFLRRDAS